MQAHLVQSHLGGHYISDSNPEDIESYCETCGDYDMILTSWEDEEENGRLNALLKYFMMNSLNNKSDLDKKVEEFRQCDMETKEIIESILDEVEFDSEETDSIVSYLHEYHEISEEEYQKIVKINSFNEERQIKMVKHFEKSYKEPVKTLKLSKTRKKKV